MKRTALALTFALTASHILAESGTPPTPAPENKETVKQPKDQPKKLSRRERKDRIQALGDKHRGFLQDVEPIMMPSELDTFLLLETDPQRDLYIVEFWRRRDQAQGTTNHAFRDQYYARLEEVKARFKYVSSDRSKIYLIHGEPAEVLSPKCERLIVPVEIWKYPYIKGFGHNARFLFYLPRMANDYRLWMPMGNINDSLADLVSQEGMATSPGGPSTAVNGVFFAQVARGMSRIEFECSNGDELMRAIFQMEQNKTDLHKLFDPPTVNEEDVRKILRSVVIATPGAPPLPAELAIGYPARQGTRTAAQMTVYVPRSALTAKEVGGTTTYSLDLTGEVLKEEQLFENFRYRFDFPGDIKDEKLPLVVDRFLRPNQYKARVRVTDVHSGAETIVEQVMNVPEVFDSPEKIKQKEAASAALDTLRQTIESNETQLRIAPMNEDILSGVQQIETIAIGSAIKAVEFYLDGKKIMVKRQPPYTLDLDLGEVPQLRKVRAVALDGAGKPLAGDEVLLNTGSDPFRVRIVAPRVAINVKGKTRVEMSVRVPEGKELQHVELFYNETRVATLYGPPWVQTVSVPETEGVGYIRAVASLKDDSMSPVEDLVMINTPGFIEDVTVHLVELPTTVLVNGRPVNTLGEEAFKILDEGKPVKLAKFEHVKNLPLSIGLAFDTSGSMTERLSEAQKAGADFFQNVLRKGDKAFVVAFDAQPHLVQKWSPNVTDIQSALAKLRAEESTALYDALVYALYNFVGVKGQRALVLISDGRDTASKFSFDQALEYARRAAVPIYGIGIGIKGTDLDVRQKLGQLTRETGGNLYYIDHAADLRKIYTDIENELRSQYVLGFYPPEGVKPGGKWREVTVQVSEGKAKTIRGYYP